MDAPLFIYSLVCYSILAIVSLPFAAMQLICLPVYRASRQWLGRESLVAIRS